MFDQCDYEVEVILSTCILLLYFMVYLSGCMNRGVWSINIIEIP